MRKLILILTLILSMGVSAQDIYVNGGYTQALKITSGDDILQGASVTFGVDFDIFKKSKFNFGPSLRVEGFSKLLSGDSEIPKNTKFSAGLVTGFDLGRWTIKSGLNYIIPVVEPGYHVLFYSSSSNTLQYRLKKDGNLAIQAGFDYLFNRNINYYTYQPTIGLSLKF